MKILKLGAALILIVCVLGLLWFMASWFIGEKRGETHDQHVSESAIESAGNLPPQNIRSSGDFVIARLLNTTLIDGFRCAAGWARLTWSGQLSQCTLAEDTVIQDNLIPKNTDIELDEKLNIKSCFFPEDTEIHGYLVHNRSAGRPGGELYVGARFYHNGRLQGFYSPYNVTIQGIPCRKIYAGFFTATPIQFHENGNLRSCTLSRDAVIDGRSISAGREVTLSEDRKITKLDDSWKRTVELWVAEIFGK